MTLIAVADLIGEDLDMAVALADGHEVRRSSIKHAPGIHERWPGGNWEIIRRPSSAWEHGGPIIERAKIDLIAGHPLWRALCGVDGDTEDTPKGVGEGETALIAAMRAYVLSKVGEAVELP
jgi:hypothetical protein